jgi:hypothetical protein
VGAFSGEVSTRPLDVNVTPTSTLDIGSGGKFDKKEEELIREQGDEGCLRRREGTGPSKEVIEVCNLSTVRPTKL